MAEILLYGDIYSYTASTFIKAVSDNLSADITVRVNSNGGSPEDTFGMIAKLQEHKGRKLIKGDGKCRSMGLFFFCYANDSECLDTTQWLLHRAAYADWIESNTMYMTEGMWEQLRMVNGHLRAALEATIDEAKLRELKGVTLDDVFDLNGRLDVNLSADEALAIGLVKRVVKITPQRASEVNAYVDRMAAYYSGDKELFKVQPNIAAATTTITQKNNHKMTLAELKAAHPELAAQIATEAVANERARVEAWMAWNEVDPEAAAKGIAEGKEVTPAAIKEMTAKAKASAELTGLQAEAAATVVTEEQGVKTGKTTKEAEAAASFMDDVNAKLKKG